MSDHETFCIHDDIFDIIKPTCKDKNIMLKFIPNEPNGNEFLSVATYMCCDKSQKNKRTISKNQPTIIFIERGIKCQLNIGTNYLTTSY